MIASLLVLALLTDVHVHGVVRDSALRVPLHGATVRVVGTQRGALTDAMGTFHLHDVHPDSGKVTLTVQHVGYATQRVVVHTDTLRDVRIEVLLVGGKQLREVVVQGTRISESALPTQAVQIVTAAEIDEHRGQTFADALQQVPGVTVVQTGPSISKPMIHGMTGTRLVLRNNGVAQEGQQWGAEHAPEIDPFTPARVAVVKGPAGVMYGPNAMGGVIDVVPRPLLHNDGMSGEATVNLFSNNLQGAAGGFVETGGLFNNTVAARINVAGRRAGDAITGKGDAPPSPYRLTNTSFAEWTLGGTLDVGTPDLGVTITSSYFATTLGILKSSHVGNMADLRAAINRGYPDPTYPFSYAIGNPKQEIAHAMLSVAARAPIGEVGLLRLTYGWQQNDRSEFDAHNTRFTPTDSTRLLQSALARPAMNLLLTTYSLDGAWDHAAASNIRGTIGVSTQRQVNDRSGTVYLVPDYTAYGVGGFVYESAAWETATISAGFRYDYRWLDVSVQQRNSLQRAEQFKTFHGISASVGGMWNAAEELTLSTNIATAWRPPQVNELYANDVHHGSAVFEIGDSTLHEERMYGFDATVRYAPQGLIIEATAYTNVFNGYILALPDAGNPTITFRGVFPTFRITQVPAIISGADLSVTATITELLNVYGTAALVRGFDTRNGLPLFMMPADRMRLGVHLHADDVAWIHDAYVDASVLGVRRQTNAAPADDYAPPPPGYALVDLTVGGMIDGGQSTQMRVSFSILNVFNAGYRDYLSRYRYFADDPGRNLVLRFTTTF